MSDTTNCPDRTKQYLLSLQTKYREDDIPTTKCTPGQQTQIVPVNPFRVMLSFSIMATAQVDVYFVNASGQLVWYASGTTPFNVTVTQNLHFLLPTMAWVAIAANNDNLTGMTIVKT